jgi:hypothetical protein
MSAVHNGRFEILEGYAPDVVAISAKGHITAADYETVLSPLIRERIARQGKVKLLYILGQEFEGVSAGAALDDAGLGLMHLGDFARIAVVTDVAWIRWGVRLFSPLFRCPVRVFGNADLDTAGSWIAADTVAPPAGPEVAATHKMLLTEDKMPENP